MESDAMLALKVGKKCGKHWWIIQKVRTFYGADRIGPLCSALELGLMMLPEGLCLPQLWSTRADLRKKSLCGLMSPILRWTAILIFAVLRKPEDKYEHSFPTQPKCPGRYRSAGARRRSGGIDIHLRLEHSDPQ